MTRLVIIATLALAIAATWIFGAMRFAERIAANQQQQIERVTE